VLAVRGKDSEPMSWVLHDYRCTSCFAVQEKLTSRSEPEQTIACACGAKAERCLSAVRVKAPTWSVDTGVGPERPPNCLDTRKYAKD
jgi:hypothetical protein